MLPEPSVLDKIYEDYIHSNPETLQSPNLSKLCKKYDADYESVRLQASEHNWLEQRVEYQKLYRKKKIEGLTASLEVHGIDIGNEISNIIQRGITVNSKYEELIDQRVFAILEDEGKVLSISELAKLKSIVSARWDSLIKVLMDTVKMLNESKSGKGGTDVSEEISALVKLLRADAIDVVIQHEIHKKQQNREDDSFDFVTQKEKQELFDKLDNSEVDDLGDLDES